MTVATPRRKGSNRRQPAVTVTVTGSSPPNGSADTPDGAIDFHPVDVVPSSPRLETDVPDTDVVSERNAAGEFPPLQERLG